MRRDEQRVAAEAFRLWMAEYPREFHDLYRQAAEDVRTRALDSEGRQLEVGKRVKTRDGFRGRIKRIDKNSRRALVRQDDGEVRMLSARGLTLVTRGRPRKAAKAA